MSDADREPTEAPPAAVEQLYAKLKEASDQFAMLRQEPYFSTVELDELVTLAGHAKDGTNWLRAQRDTAEQKLARKCTELDATRATIEALPKEIAAACDSGMRLTLPAAEIVGRIRAVLDAFARSPQTVK